MVFNLINWNKSILVLLLTVVLHKANGQCTIPGFSVAVPTDTICSGTQIPLLPSGATSYTLNPGNIVSNFLLVSPTVTTVYSVSATSGTCVATVTINITVLPVPTQPGAITGNTLVSIPASLQSYSISPIAGATSYNWSLPNGWSGSSTTNSINIGMGTAYTNTLISVSVTNSCGISPTRTLAITSYTCNAPNQPSAVIGNTLVLAGSVQTYSTLMVPGATSYNWQFPSDWTGSSTTNTISVSVGNTSGYIAISAINSCNWSSYSNILVTVTSTCTVPNQPVAIIGNTLAPANSMQTYSVAPVASATSYAWLLLPSGFFPSSTSNTVSINVGNITDTLLVVAINSCGASITNSLIITITSGCPVPNQPGVISGNTTVNSGSIETYSISPVVGATSYVWTLPAGYTGSSTSNSISVTIGATNGVISVVAQNSCGISNASSLQISVPTSTANAANGTCMPQLVKDIAPGVNPSAPLRFCSNNGVLFFVADDKVNGYELWKSDGTTAGTVLVKDINPTGSGFYTAGKQNVVSMGGNVYFPADDGINGTALWKSDGTSAGTTMVKDITPGIGTSVWGLYSFNNAVYFIADDNVNGYELWKSDGTTAGTVMVKDIRVGPYDGVNTSYLEFATLNNMLYFTACDNAVGSPYELWKTDGTTMGTTKVTTSMNYKFATYPKYLTEYNGNLYFSAESKDINGNTSTSAELYKSDGTDAGTVLLKDINPTLYYGSYPTNFTVANNLLFFIANDGLTGSELWKTDGSANGTVLVKDIRTGNSSGLYYTNDRMAAANGYLFFTGNDGINGDELWKTDGSATNTTMIKDVRSGSSSSFDSYNDFLAINGVVYFKAHNGTLGFELWKTDGSLAGTMLTNDIMPPGYTGSSSSNPSLLFNHNGVLYFTADNGPTGTELWKCDDAIISVTENSKENDSVLIYPNPGSGIFQIRNDLHLKDATIKIYNTQGQTIFESTQLISEFDLSDKPKGIYFLQIKAENKIINKKIIVQ